MKNIKTFGSFINESIINEAMSVSKAHKILLDGYSAAEYMEEKSDEKELVSIVNQICTLLGEIPEKVAGLDEYVDDPEELMDVYNSLSSKFRGDEVAGVDSDEYIVRFDKKLHVAVLENTMDDFMTFWFTSKSKF